MSFIPAFHFVSASDKLKKENNEFAWSCIQFYWHQGRRINLLEGKDIEQIEGFSDGNYSLRPFKTMFRSMRNQLLTEGNPNISKADIDKLNTTGIQMYRVALIPPKLNSGIATQQKVPIEITATCLDALAQKKKQEDLDFLRNKEKMKEALQPLYDSMNLGDVDLGATQHSSVPFTGMPMDLDVNDEDEFRLFANMMYNLAPESAIETILKAFSELKKLQQIRLLETRDQYKFGVSVNDGFADKNTDLPNIEYIYPGRMFTDGSELPDYSDNTIRLMKYEVTPMELFKYFPNEICDENFLNKIVNFGGGRGDWGTGYTICNSYNKVEKTHWNTFKMLMYKVQVKSVDSIMIAQKPKSGYKYFTNDEAKCTKKIWAQNTYTFFWLANTKWFFGIDRLGFAYRSKGSEIYTGFSTNIYRSQPISAVEHCIGENVKAQMADIKLQFEIITSSPPGKVVDIKYVRNVIDGLKDEMNQYTEKSILDKGFESNVWLIDSEGFENKQGQGQFLPVKDLPGGLKDSILGYYKVRFEADRNISAYLSINDQLTGQSVAPDMLVGTQKLLLSASINGLDYVREAIQSQYQSLFTIWAYYIQEAIKKGGAAKKAIENIIGSRKVEILRGLDVIPLHQIGIVIKLSQREEERALNKEIWTMLFKANVLNAADVYEIEHTDNPKDVAWLIAVKQNRWQKKQEQMQIRQMESAEKISQQQNETLLGKTQQEGQNELNVVNQKGQNEAKLKVLTNQLGMGQKQFDAYVKRLLQSERGDMQKDKAIATIREKSSANQQEALAL